MKLECTLGPVVNWKVEGVILCVCVCVCVFYTNNGILFSFLKLFTIFFCGISSARGQTCTTAAT